MKTLGGTYDIVRSRLSRGPCGDPLLLEAVLYETTCHICRRGYLFAQGSLSILGRKTNQNELNLDENELVRQLKSLALSKNAGADILRIYWYDGARNGPTTEHLAIANMQDVKLRLGSINNYGQQKEVDSLLVTDLIELARNQSICDATIVSGDSDLRIAVQIAQSFGVRVHLIGLEPSGVSQSRSLRQEADTVHEISKESVSKFLSHIAKPNIIPDPAVSVATVLSKQAQFPIREASTSIRGGLHTLGAILEEAVEKTLAPCSPDGILRLKEVLATSPEIPPEHDRRLLGISRTLLERDLTGDERREMRKAFKRKVLSSDGPTA